MNFKKNYASWRKYRQAVTELNAMSDRDLADLGISRGDIHHVARAGIN